MKVEDRDVRIRRSNRLLIVGHVLRDQVPAAIGLLEHSRHVLLPLECWPAEIGLITNLKIEVVEGREKYAAFHAVKS